MKRAIIISAISWLALISVLHIWLNIGFERLARDFQVNLGNERAELVVGFLPVT
ncbi:MAG: hypothetical protein ABGY71_04895 [bacterium]|jgi:hypothetical protein